MIDIDQATKWAELFARVGFPALVAMFILWRVESALKELTVAVVKLTGELHAAELATGRHRPRGEER